MQPTVKLRIAAAMTLALALSSSARAQTQQPSTDDSPAKVAKAKPSRKARLVYTDDDMPHHAVPAVDVQPASQTSEPGAPSQHSESGNARGINVPGLLVGGTVSDARELLDRLHQEENLLNQRYEQLQQQLAATDSAQLRQVYSDALSHREETLAKTRKKIADTEKALAAASSGKQGDTNNAAK